ARVAAVARQLDRRRHLGDPAQHHREARSRTAGLTGRRTRSPMSLLLTEDQQLLKQSAAEFVKNESPVSRVRHYRDDRDALGFSRELWAKMAELGWPAILLPESYGGLGMGYKDLACVLEECGRNLVP